MTETLELRRSLIRVATTSLWAFGGAQLTREQAEALLPSWVHADLLDEDARTEVLWHIGGDAQPEAEIEPEPVPAVIESVADEVTHASARYLHPDGRVGRTKHGFKCTCGDVFEGASAPRARAALDSHLAAVSA